MLQMRETQFNMDEGEAKERGVFLSAHITKSQGLEELQPRPSVHLTLFPPLSSAVPQVGCILREPPCSRGPINSRLKL